MTRSTSTDGLTTSDHIEPSVSHTDVSSTATVYYAAASSKPVGTVCHAFHTDISAYRYRLTWVQAACHFVRVQWVNISGWSRGAIELAVAVAPFVA